MESTPFSIFCDTICRNHFRSWDHLRSNLGIICGPQQLYAYTGSERVPLRYILLFICCFVEHPPDPIVSCKLSVFKPFWFKNQTQLSAHFWGTCLQGIFQGYYNCLNLWLITDHYIVHASRNCTRSWRSE